MMGIQTFVFFDLETTGLIHGNTMPRITEMALIAVARESICNSKESIPRVLHKLVLPINPQRVIPTEVEYLTKLSNEDIRLLQPFECEIYELIKHFLQRLTPPICFAAHNGYRFDYPIFLWELERVNKIFDTDILCIDTWHMFRDFFKKDKHSKEHIMLPYPSNTKRIQDLLDDEYNESLCEALDLVMMKEESKQVEINAINVCASSICDSEMVKSFSEQDRYTTISHNKYGNYSDLNNRSSTPCIMQKINETTPKSQIINLQNVAKRRSKKNNSSRRRLNFGCEKPVNFKLTAIYEYMFSSSFTHEHSAESDCLAMIRCVSQVADFFVEWSDNNACPLVIYKKNDMI